MDVDQLAVQPAALSDLDLLALLVHEIVGEDLGRLLLTVAETVQNFPLDLDDAAVAALRAIALIGVGRRVIRGAPVTLPNWQLPVALLRRPTTAAASGARPERKHGDFLRPVTTAATVARSHARLRPRRHSLTALISVAIDDCGWVKPSESLVVLLPV